MIFQYLHEFQINIRDSGFSYGDHECSYLLGYDILNLCLFTNISEKPTAPIFIEEESSISTCVLGFILSGLLKCRRTEAGILSS